MSLIFRNSEGDLHQGLNYFTTFPTLCICLSVFIFINQCILSKCRVLHKVQHILQKHQVLGLLEMYRCGMVGCGGPTATSWAEHLVGLDAASGPSR